MAIAFDTVGSSGIQTTGTNYSWTHTITGNKPVLAVSFAIRPAGGQVGTLLFNGTALTKIGTVENGNRHSEMWYGVGVRTGLGTINAQLNGAPSNSDGHSLSLTGVDQTNPLDANSSSNAATGTHALGTITTVAKNAWIVDSLSTGVDDGVATPDSPQTLASKIANTGGHTGAQSYQGPIITPAATTDGYGVTSSNWAIFLASFRPSRAGTNLIQSAGTTGLATSADSASWLSNTTTGNLIVVGVAVTNALSLGTVSSITDTQSNSYVRAIRGTISEATSVINAEIWYAKNITGGAGSVTVNHSSDNAAVFVREYSGFNTLDQTNSATGSTAAPNTGTSSNTIIATELIVMVAGDDKGATQTYAAAGDYGDAVGTTATLTGVSMLDNIVTATGAQTGTEKFGSAANWVGLISTFYLLSTGAAGYRNLLGVGI